MRQLRNPAKDRLEKGELAIGVGVRGLRGVEVARLGLGFRMVLAGNDISLLHTAAQEQAKFVRELVALPRQ